MFAILTFHILLAGRLHYNKDVRAPFSDGVEDFFPSMEVMQNKS